MQEHDNLNFEINNINKRLCSKKMKTPAPDKRVDKTIAKLERALFKLLKNNDGNDITVLRLCEEAKIYRSTFYSYFKSIDELMEFLQNKYITEFKIEIKNNYEKPEEIYDFYIRLLNKIYSRQEIYYCLYIYNFTWMFEKTLTAAIDAMIPKNENMPLTQTELKLIKTFNSYGCNGVIREWLLNDCKDKIEDVAKALYTCSTVNLHIYNSVF